MRALGALGGVSAKLSDVRATLPTRERPSAGRGIAKKTKLR